MDTTPKVSKRAASSPKTETWVMRGPGATTGKSGEIYHHVKEDYKEKGKNRTRFICTVAAGDFDHLTDKEGESRHVSGKL